MDRSTETIGLRVPKGFPEKLNELAERIGKEKGFPMSRKDLILEALRLQFGISAYDKEGNF